MRQSVAYTQNVIDVGSNPEEISQEDETSGVAEWTMKNRGKTLKMILTERDIAMPKWDACNPEAVKAGREVSTAFA